MAQLLIRDLEPDVVARLKARAGRNRRSLQSEARMILEESVHAGTDTFQDIVDRAAEIRAATRRRVVTNGADLIREDRDR